MSEQLKEALVKASYKTVVWFLVFHILDYLVESTFIDRIKELGLVSWVLLYVIFVISNLIQSKFIKKS